MDDYEYTFVRLKIRKLTGVDLDDYKSTQMQRRLQAFLHRSGYSSWAALFRAIQNDPKEIDKLRDYLTINVSYFFRDPDKFKYLQEFVLPELLRGRTNLRVWSAGCSRGHEPYTLAMILAEMTGPYRPHEIYATDIDRSALEWARAGGPYTVEEIVHVPAALLNRYFGLRNGNYWFTHPVARRRVVFGEHNLMAEPFALPGTGEGGFDLIVCRNVVIYFTAEGKERLYRHLRDALRPGGVLFIGGTEIVSKAADMGLQAVSMSFYRRADEPPAQPRGRVSRRVAAPR